MIEFKVEQEFNQEFETTVSEQEVVVSLLFSDLTKEWFIELKELNRDGDRLEVQGLTKITSKLKTITNGSFKGCFYAIPKKKETRNNPDKLDSFEDDFFFLYLNEQEVVNFENNKKI